MLATKQRRWPVSATFSSISCSRARTTRTAREISQGIDRVGGDINAFTSKEYTAYHCRLPARHQLLGVDLLGDIVTSPALRADDVENERLVILEELAMDDDSPDDVAHRSFSSQLFPDHPLGTETAGSQATVEAISATAMRNFHDDHYRAGSTVVAICGPLDHDLAIAQIERSFAGLPAGNGRVARTGPGAARRGEVVER